jgi:hypothetical protein
VDRWGQAHPGPFSPPLPPPGGSFLSSGVFLLPAFLDAADFAPRVAFPSGFSPGLLILQKVTNLFIQTWQIVPNCVPDFLQINTEILMHQQISHGYNLLPGNFLMFLPEF